MPTVNLNLYDRFVPGEPVDAGHNRLLANQFGGTPPQPVNAGNAGDTLAVSLYFLDDLGGNRFRGHRYPGATVEVNLWAQGNNHIYAIGTSTTEIAPASTAPSAVYVQNHPHGDGVESVQRILFASQPFTGTFSLTWGGPGFTGDGGIGPRGTITLPVTATTADIQAAIRALPFYQYNNNPPIPAFGDYSPYVFVTGTALTNFLIEFQRGSGYVGKLPLAVIGFSDVQYKFGYSVSVPLTAGDFTDLFLSANGPAYLDVILTPSGGSPALAAQYRLTSSNPGQPPVANFFADSTSGNPGSAINFSDLSTNTPTTWAWDFGDGGTSTTQNPSHTYAAAGLYTVILTATNASGSDGETKTNYINIASAPPPPGAVDDCSGGGGANPALPCTYFDGPYHLLSAVAIPCLELNDEHPDLDVWHERFQQRSSFLNRIPIGAAAGTQGGRLARDTIWQQIGSDVVEWDRVTHNVPADSANAFGFGYKRSFPVAIQKNYQSAWYTIQNGNTTDISIVTWSAKIKATCYVHYFMEGDAITFPVFAFIQIIPIFGGAKLITDLGTGFPTGAGGRYTANDGVSYVDSGIEKVIGKLRARLLIYG